jgi:hypothetical protein
MSRDISIFPFDLSLVALMSCDECYLASSCRRAAREGVGALGVLPETDGISSATGIGFHRTPEKFVGQSDVQSNAGRHRSVYSRTRTMAERTYGVLEPGYPGVISFIAQLALKISRRATPYQMSITPSWSRSSGRCEFCAPVLSVGGVTP